MLSAFRPGLCAGAAILVLAAALPPAEAIAAPAAPLFDIDAGPLDAALLAFAAQSRQQLLYDAATVRGLRAPALKGRFSPRDGLARLLAGADILVQEGPPGVFVLKPKSTVPSVGDAPPAPPSALSTPPQATAAPAVSAADAAADVSTVDAVVVTGTLIRGPAALPSPVLVIGREDLDQSGQATVADLLTRLPQNFAGVATPATLLTTSDGLGTNDAAASGVNLRGLGATATLVLVNGRRMAGSGLKGDFADLSAIPTAAVDRVEVLLDGASALYGSDAVGGVVNIILRQDYDGAETRLRLGGARGGAGQLQVSQVLGQTWSGGHVLLAYEHQSDRRLPAAARRFTASRDLRPLGGTDHRTLYAHPGNLLSYDPVLGQFVAAYAIPSGQNGLGLTPGDFIAGVANLENDRAGADILPQQQRDSLYLDLRQDLTPALSLTLDSRYSRRRFNYNFPASASIFSVTSANPYFVSPDGASSALIGYGFGDELGPTVSDGVAENFGASVGVDISLPGDWRAEVYGALAGEKSRRHASHNLNSGYLDEALGNIPDDPSTAFSTAVDGFFNPYGDGGANSQAILDFIGSGTTDTWNDSQVTTVNAKADGTLFRLPGGAVKLAVGAQWRQERFTPRVVARVSGSTPYAAGGSTFSRDIAAAFLELRAPLFGADNARPGLQRLELSLAGRVERYDGVGVTRNPKLGLIWTPVSGLDFRASYGTSFRAPALTELNDVETIAPSFLTTGSGQTLVILQYGGNTGLKPETARTWTFGASWTPPRLTGLRLEASAFAIDFDNRIGQPVLENLDVALTDPSYAPFVRLVDPVANPADLARVQALIDRSTVSSISLFPATAYGAIVDARDVNAASLQVRGLDLQASYSFDRGADHYDLAFNGTRLDRYRRKLTPTAPPADLLGTAGEPVRFRARASLAWRRESLAANLGLNYVDDYAAGPSRRVDSWTTVDLQLSWRAPQTAGPWQGVSLALSANNLFDRDPPFYDSPQGVGYDPANADPLGRFVSVQLTKRW